MWNMEYHIEFFKAGMSAIIKKWLLNNCKESPEEMIEILDSEYKGKKLKIKIQLYDYISILLINLIINVTSIQRFYYIEQINNRLQSLLSFSDFNK